MIHQAVSVVSQCGAGAWLYGLARGDQRQLTESGSASEACLRRCATQMHCYFILLYVITPSVEDDVNVWCYAILNCMPETTTTTLHYHRAVCRW